MRYRLVWFLTQHRAGRKFTILTHGRLYHRNQRYGLRFASGARGCWLCHLVTRQLREMYPDAYEDRSSIKVSDPVYDADGKLLKHGVSMTATAKRQLDAIMADPDKGAAIQKAIDEIAKDPGGSKP